HPIGVRISLPFEKQYNEMGFAIAPGQLDPATKGRTWCGNAVDYEAERQLVAFELEVGSSGRMPFFVSQFSRPPGTALLPVITVDVERTECEAFARRTITCGQSSEETPLPGKGR